MWVESETWEHLEITFLPIPKTAFAEEAWEYSKLLSLSCLPHAVSHLAAN